jgi:hypothetical protein
VTVSSNPKRERRIGQRDGDGLVQLNVDGAGVDQELQRQDDLPMRKEDVKDATRRSSHARQLQGK